MKVLIVGAGPGGLTAALSLHEAGIDVEVYEAAQTLRPLGVGINCLPHSARELVELGLGDALDATAVRTRELVYANKFGQTVWREDRGEWAGYRWPQYSVHRGRLQMLLWETALQRLGRERLHTDHSLVRFEQTDADVVAYFESRPVGASGGSAGERRSGSGESRGSVRADLLIAADGIHSAVRRQLYPDEGPPLWNGAILWRGVTRAKPFLTGASMVQAGHEWQKFVCYPISRIGDDGLQDINWIAEIKYRDRSKFDREDWNRPGRLDDFLPQFESWNFGWLDCPALVRGAAQCFEFPMIDRDPLPAWTHGRVTLLGDAAHPMYPIGSNGASQAIIDARVLAWRLATGADWREALRLYEDERRPATARIVAANRGNGPDQVLQIAEERAPRGFARDVEEAIPRAELEAIANQYKAMAGFDKERLNTRPSYSVKSEAR